MIIIPPYCLNVWMSICPIIRKLPASLMLASNVISLSKAQDAIIRPNQHQSVFLFLYEYQ